MDELLRLVSIEDRPAVQSWLTRTGASFTSGGWVDRGNSGARLFSVTATSPRTGARHLIVKRTPPRPDVEPEAVRLGKAEQDSPPGFADRHLAVKAAGFEPVELPGAAWLLFQEIGGGSFREYRSLAGLLSAETSTPSWLAPACRGIVDVVLPRWNPDPDVVAERMTPAEFLSVILGGRLDPGGPLDTWVREDPRLARDPAKVSIDGTWHANPLALARLPAIGGVRRLQVLTGRCHGDLHPGNVLIPLNDRTDSGRYRLVDLSRYSRTAPLAAEPAYLMTDLLGLIITGKPDARPTAVQRHALVRYVADPDTDSRAALPSGLADTIDAVRDTALEWASRKGFRDDWNAQWLLSLVGCGLIYAGRARRAALTEAEWFHLLSALAADAFLRDFGPAEPQPNPLTVPARPAHPISRGPAVEAMRRAWDRVPRKPLLVHGEPGVGKTQLAVEYARRSNADYSDVAWVDARRPEGVESQFTNILRGLGMVASTDPAVLARQLFGALSRYGHWLLVLDGVGDDGGPAVDLRSFEGGFDILATSRSDRLPGAGAAYHLKPLRNAESARLLRTRIRRLSPEHAKALAERLGNLPLAIDQAADYLHDGSMTPSDYLRSLEEQPGKLLTRGRPASYPESLSGVWSAALRRLGPDARRLLSTCAVFGSAPIPLTVLRAHAAAGGAPDGMDLTDQLREVTDLGLVSSDGQAVVMNPLLQTFLRDGQLLGDFLDEARAGARLALASIPRGDPRIPGNWATYGAIRPHAIALRVEADGDAASRRLTVDLIRFLNHSGDAAGARRLASSVRNSLSGARMDEDESALEMCSALAQALYALGDPAAAADLDERILRERGDQLGEADRATLQARHNLAADLSAVAALRGPEWRASAARALQLHETNYEARRALLGDKDGDTLLSLVNLAFTARIGGDLRRARHLSGLALEGLRAALGKDHPHTLHCAHRHALDLQACGSGVEALDLFLDTYQRRRSRLGPRHPDTMYSALALAAGHRAGHDYPAAHPLDVLARRNLSATLGPSHPETLRAAHGLSRDLLGLGDAASALALAQETYRRRADTLGDMHLDTLRTAGVVARALALAGDEARANKMQRVVAEGIAALQAEAEYQVSSSNRMGGPNSSGADPATATQSSPS